MTPRFGIHPDDQALADAITRFAQAELAPHAHEVDESALSTVRYVPALAELGVMGMNLPERWGGPGATPTAAIQAPNCTRSEADVTAWFWGMRGGMLLGGTLAVVGGTAALGGTQMTLGERWPVVSIAANAGGLVMLSAATITFAIFMPSWYLCGQTACEYVRSFGGTVTECSETLSNGFVASAASAGGVLLALVASIVNKIVIPGEPLPAAKQLPPPTLESNEPHALEEGSPVASPYGSPMASPRASDDDEPRSTSRRAAAEL